VAAPGDPMSFRLHRSGRFRAWLGARFGGDPALGDRIWRRVLHLAGLAVLLYYAIPENFFLLLPKEIVLVLALAMVLALEGMRLAHRLEMPTIRPHEEGRVASFALYGIGLTAAVLIFPRPTAVAVVLGVAFVDPLAGELRLRTSLPGWGLWALPVLVYAVLASLSLEILGAWHWPAALIAGVGLGILATAVERPKLKWYDDDLGMTLIPAAALTLALWLWPWLPGWG
jgi:hypothetical protein